MEEECVVTEKEIIMKSQTERQEEQEGGRERWRKKVWKQRIYEETNRIRDTEKET